MGGQNSVVSTGIEHQKLNHGRIVNGNKIAIDYVLNDQYRQWEKRLTSCRRTSTKSLFLPQVQQTQRENMCGSVKSISLIFDVYRYTLFCEIKKRKEVGQRFEEKQLWFLLYNLLEASSIFEKRRQKSGDIRPKNVLIDEKGEIAVVNMLTFPDETTNYLKSLDFQVAAYLAPEELSELQVGNRHCRADPPVAESFSIGLTILDAALLTDSEELYDCSKIRFKISEFNNHLGAFRQLQMSSFFIKTVLNLMQVKTFHRPSPGQALSILLPYQNEILNLDMFVPDREKSKISLQVYQHSKI